MRRSSQSVENSRLAVLFRHIRNGISSASQRSRLSKKPWREAGAFSSFQSHLAACTGAAENPVSRTKNWRGWHTTGRLHSVRRFVKTFFDKLKRLTALDRSAGGMCSAGKTLKRLCETENGLPFVAQPLICAKNGGSIRFLMNVKKLLIQLAYCVIMVKTEIGV